MEESYGDPCYQCDLMMRMMMMKKKKKMDHPKNYHKKCRLLITRRFLSPKKKVPEFVQKHLKKTGGHIGRNVVNITIKIRTTVQITWITQSERQL